MTRYGKLNLLGMVMVPCAAAVSGLIVFGTNWPAIGYIFAMNSIAGLVAGLFSGLMLLWANKRGGNDLACKVAISPTIIPAVFFSVWYLWRAISPAEVGPGAEYIAAPQYHVMAVLFLGIVAFILGFFVRGR